MSASMIVNTGTMRSPILRDTTMNIPKDAIQKHLAGLVMKTTGIDKGSPAMTGVLQATVPANRRDRPEITKVAKGEVGKTQTKKMGQVAFAGPKY